MEIEKFGLKELSLTETKEVNGGSIFGGLLLTILTEIINDWDNFKNGIAGKPEIAKQ